MTEQLETFMTEELGIIERLGSEPLEGLDLFVDVGNNVWNLDQIIHAFNNQWVPKEYALAMSKALGNLNFLVNRTKEEWSESFTTSVAIRDAYDALIDAQKEYDKVLTLLRQANTL